MNKLKKLLLGAVATTLLFGATPLTKLDTAHAATTSFTDISGHWAEAAIKQAANLGLVKGYADGSFKPGSNVTRGEFAVMLARATKQTPSMTGVAFSDVAKNNYAYASVNKITALGFVKKTDYSAGLKPNTAMSREEIAKWLATGLAASSAEFNKALSDVAGPYALVPVTEFYKGGLNKSNIPNISVMMGTGIMMGDTKGSFNPRSNVTRAEVASILIRYMGVEGSKASGYTALNELREVATTGTNVTSFTPLEYVKTNNTSTFKEMIGKDIKMKSAVADVKVHRMIVLDLDVQTKAKHSIYTDMFSKDTWNWRTGYVILTEQTAKANISPNTLSSTTFQNASLSAVVGIGNIDTESVNYGVTFGGFHLEKVNGLYKSVPYLSQSKAKKFWGVGQMVSKIRSGNTDDINLYAKDGSYMKLVNSK